MLVKQKQNKYKLNRNWQTLNHVFDLHYFMTHDSLPKFKNIPTSSPCVCVWIQVCESSTRTLHSRLAILSSDKMFLSGGRYSGRPTGEPTGGVMALRSITLPVLVRWNFDGCWWEKDWERPRLRLAWCRSRISLTAGLDGLFLRDKGRASGGGLDTDAVNCSFSFMCWLNSKRPARNIWKATLTEIVLPFRQ